MKINCLLLSTIELIAPRTGANIYCFKIYNPYIQTIIIRITCLCNLYPLTPHLYIVKLGFTFFLILALKPRMSSVLMCTTIYVLKKNIIIFHLKVIIFTAVKNCCILHMHVFVMC